MKNIIFSFKFNKFDNPVGQIGLLLVISKDLQNFNESDQHNRRIIIHFIFKISAKKKNHLFGKKRKNSILQIV